MPISPFLKSSSIVHVVSLNAKYSLVAFKKKFDHLLTSDCRSLRRNKPYIDRIKPFLEAKLVDFNKTKFSYLPKFVSVTKNMRLVYVDMRKREAENFNDSNGFLSSYPIDSRAFNVYIVDHNALVLSSHLQKSGVNFIYHPRLSKNVAQMVENTKSSNDEEFYFLAWFKETDMYSNLVVLKMSVGRAELKFLAELFEKGVICSVDKLFLECLDSNFVDVVESYIDLFKKLRSTGVFLHQWWCTSHLNELFSKTKLLVSSYLKLNISPCELS